MPIRTLIILLLASVPVSADPHDALYGTWGTAEQCARTLLIPGGTVTASPFEIGPDWLKHGQLWCQLTWYPVESRDDGLFTAARAQCGEDAVQDYFLRLKQSQGALTLRWDVFLSNGPLERCAAP